MWLTIVSGIGFGISLLLCLIFMATLKYCKDNMFVAEGKVIKVRIVGQSIDAPIFKTIIPTIKYAGKNKKDSFEVEGPVTSTPFSVGETIPVYYTNNAPERAVIHYTVKSRIINTGIFSLVFLVILVASLVF